MTECRKPGNPGGTKGTSLPAPQGRTWSKPNGGPSAPGGDRIREDQRGPAGANNKLPH